MWTKAAILEKQKTRLIVEELEIPKLSVGQVLVEVFISGICGAQLGEVSGRKGSDPYLPHLLGHEGGGIVREIGPGVKHVREGDRVVMHWRRGVGIESDPPKYKRKGGTFVGGGLVTTFNTLAVVSENRLTSVSFTLPFEIAALLGCSITTGFGLVNNEAKLKIGQSIAVAGCGGVGLNVLKAAKMVSAFPRIGIDLHATKQKMALAVGATNHLSSKSMKSMETNIRIITGIRGVDVFVDTTGVTEMIAAGLRLTAPGGRLILVGQPQYMNTLTLPQVAHDFQGKTVLDSQGGLTNPTVDIPRYVALYEAESIRFDDIECDYFPLELVNDAMHFASDGRIGRCLLRMGPK